MKDMVTNGTGNSRYLKSSVPAGTTWAEVLTMLRDGTFPVDFNGLNPAGITQQGSAYSKANVLPDDVCASLGIDGTTAEPKDAFASVASRPRPNLLKNGYFVGGGSQQGGGQFPINQSGQTSYSANSYTNAIDRWYTQGGSNDNLSVVIGTESVNLVRSGNSGGYPTFSQIIEAPEKFAGETFTISVLYKNPNGIRCIIDPKNTAGSGGGLTRLDLSDASADWTLANGTFTLPSGSTQFRIFIYVGYLGDYNGEIQLKAIKLELGSTQTLAHQENGEWVLNEIPDYNEELVRCMDTPAQIETGSYVGTGTYGSSNPNSITFGFKPKLVIIGKESSSIYANMTFVDALTSEYSNPGYSLMWSGQSGYPIYGKIDGTTLSWYNSNGNATNQLNESSKTYRYIAIG